MGVGGVWVSSEGDRCASFNSLVVITNLLFRIKFGLSVVGV